LTFSTNGTVAGQEALAGFPHKEAKNGPKPRRESADTSLDSGWAGLLSTPRQKITVDR
jgi:hypothetical protein